MEEDKLFLFAFVNKERAMQKRHLSKVTDKVLDIKKTPKNRGYLLSVYRTSPHGSLPHHVQGQLVGQGTRRLHSLRGQPMGMC